MNCSIKFNLSVKIVLPLLFVLFFMNAPLFAQNDAKTLESEINKDLRSAQSLIFNGQMEKAQKMIPQIESNLEELNSIDPENTNIMTFKDKIDKLKSDIGSIYKKTPSATQSSSKSRKSSKQDTATIDSSSKLQGGAARCIREIDNAIKKAQRSLDSQGPSSVEYKAEQARYEMKSADMYWNDLSTKYPDTLTHPDVISAKNRIDDFYAKIDSFEKGIEQEQQEADLMLSEIESDSNIWIDKLIPYTASPGHEKHDPDKYFISGYTEIEEDMNHRMKLYAEAMNTLSEYLKAEFPDGKTEELEKTAEDLQRNLDSFKEELLSGANIHIQQAQREISYAVSRLANNINLNAGDKPVVLNDYVLNSIFEKISWAANLLPGDPRIDDLNNQFDALKNEQSKWREKMIEDTRMLSDEFQGADSEEIKSKAESIVKQKYPQAGLLRVNIISRDWKEERVLEFTDSTQSAVKYRITRGLTVQVAAANSGECFIYSVYIAKDRLSTGGWTDLYGHIMFIDKILEENVDK